MENPLPAYKAERGFFLYWGTLLEGVYLMQVEQGVYPAATASS